MEYKVDVERSEVAWEGRKRIGKVEQGIVKFSAGNLRVEEGQVASGEFTVDLQTINAMDPKSGAPIESLNKHLKSDDFFGVEKYPEASLKITGVEAGRAAGEMTIKGITRPIDFQVELDEREGEVVLKTEFSFDRSLFEIKYGSDKFFKSLGDELIEDEVNLKVKVVATT